MNTAFETVTVGLTPKLAREMLNKDNQLREEGKNQTRQRFMTGAKVSQYREDYRAGKWRRNHQGMLFTEHGEILDGQHRLEAIAGLENGSYPTQVSTCDHRAAKEVMLTIDGGKPRDVATQLWVTLGMENSQYIVAAVRAEAILVSGLYKHGGLSSAQILQAIEMHKHAIETVVSILRSGSKRLAHSSLSGPLSLYATASKAKAIEFAESYVSLENLGSTSPVLWLKRGFERGAKRKIQWHRTGYLAMMTANALMAYDLDKRLNDIPSATDEAGRLWLIEKAKPICNFLESLVAAAVRTRGQIRSEQRRLRRG